MIAKPQLRGAEGEKLSLNLGDEIPVPATVFTPFAQGGANVNPLTSFNYKPVGVNVVMTPRVTFENDIILDLEVESSTLGRDVNIAGQNLPSFGSRKVKTKLRLRDGESNLMAGLLRERKVTDNSGLVGLARIPILRNIFGKTDQQMEQSDIVVVITPRIVRSHELTVDDLKPMPIGTQQAIFPRPVLIETLDEHYKTPVTYNFNLTFEREVMPGVRARAAPQSHTTAQ